MLECAYLQALIVTLSRCHCHELRAPAKRRELVLKIGGIGGRKFGTARKMLYLCIVKTKEKNGALVKEKKLPS